MRSHAIWRERERERERGWVECFNTRINEKYKMEKHWTTSSHPTRNTGPYSLGLAKRVPDTTRLRPVKTRDPFKLDPDTTRLC
jgi:hypothetical protein